MYDLKIFNLSVLVFGFTALLTSEIDMIMVNAIFFKSIWDSPFHKYKTRAESFRIDKDKAVEVPFMRQVGRFFAGEDTQMGIKWAALPFKVQIITLLILNLQGS